MLDILIAFTGFTIFAQVFAIGLSRTAEGTFAFLRDGLALGRSMLAVLVLVPAIAALLLTVLQLEAAVAIGIVLLAAAPAAPLTTRRSFAAGADTDYVASVQLTAALLAIVVTPLLLAVFSWLFEPKTISISPLVVARQIAFVTFLPAVLGMIVAKMAPVFVERYRETFEKGAVMLFLVLLIVIILLTVFVADFRGNILIGWPAVAALVVFAGAALAVGHILGGPSVDRRAGLAIACVARNIGLALYLAEVAEGAIAAIPTIVTFAFVGGILATIYSIWVKHLASAG